MKHRYMLFALPGEWLDNCENIAEMHVKQKYLSKAANIAQISTCTENNCADIQKLQKIISLSKERVL